MMMFREYHLLGVPVTCHVPTYLLALTHDAQVVWMYIDGQTETEEVTQRPFKPTILFRYYHYTQCMTAPFPLCDFNIYR